MEEISQHIGDWDAVKEVSVDYPAAQDPKQMEKNMKIVGELLSEDELLHFSMKRNGKKPKLVKKTNAPTIHDQSDSSVEELPPMDHLAVTLANKIEADTCPPPSEVQIASPPKLFSILQYKKYKSLLEPVVILGTNDVDTYIYMCMKILEDYGFETSVVLGAERQHGLHH